jgi:hypothetical protein
MTMTTLSQPNLTWSHLLTQHARQRPQVLLGLMTGFALMMVLDTSLG